MLKLILCAALIAAGAGGGVYLSRRYQARVRQLDQCALFLSRLQTNLGMEQLTTRELFARLAGSESLRELTFIGETAKGLETSVVFPEVWRQSLRASRGELALREDDYRLLDQLAELVGAFDAPTQLQGLEVTRQLLRENAEQALEQSRTSGKLSRSLGLLSGVAAAILIL